MEVNGKRVLVVGLGKSGVASALFLHKRGARVSVSDAKSPEQLRQEIPVLLDAGITVETGEHGERTFREQDLIVISPGVPFDMPQLARARERGIPIIGEVELAYSLPEGQHRCRHRFERQDDHHHAGRRRDRGFGTRHAGGRQHRYTRYQLRRHRDRADLDRAGDQQLPAGDGRELSAQRLRPS